MANASFVITLTSPRSVADLARFIKDTTDPRGEARVLEKLFERASSGLETCSFDVQTSSNAPVRASQTLTCAYASLTANDTVTIGTVVLTCSSSTTDATHFKKVTDGPTTCANLVTCIKANTTLNKFLTASATTSGVGVVTITALTPGTIANQVSVASSAAGFVAGAAFMASGAGGSETVAVNYSRGL